jgi:signal transduction histidine kinase
LRVEGDPFSLEPGLDLSAYRVLQEALTNTLKHAPSAKTEITIRYLPLQLEIEVVNHAATANANTNGRAIGGAGRGLIGMRERVNFYGGTLTHGPRPEGGFRVRATFPIRRAQ